MYDIKIIITDNNSEPLQMTGWNVIIAFLSSSYLIFSIFSLLMPLFLSIQFTYYLLLGDKALIF